MPDDRMIHRRMLRGDRIASLTDFERGVWLAYQLLADDFGVMRFSAIDLQKAVWLETKPQKTIQRAFQAVVDTGLIHVFQDGGRTQVYQRDWNSWQKVRHPRTTIEPCPPAEELLKCDVATQALFRQHSRCPPEFLQKDSGNVSEIVPQHSGFTRAPALANANGNGERLEANGKGAQRIGSVMSGALPKNHLSHAWCGRVCVPEFLHNQFTQATGRSDEELYAFYKATFDAIPLSESVDPDSLKFWRPRVVAKWPPKRVEASGPSAESIVAAIRERAAQR